MVHSKTQKLVHVKGTVVHGKDKAYLRDQHNRKMEVAIDPNEGKSSYISGKITNTLQSGKITDIKNIEDLGKAGGVKRGITNGVKFLRISGDGPDSPSKTAYFKAIDDDPFISYGRLLRSTIKLHDKQTEKPLTHEDEYYDVKKLPDSGRETHKGYMLDRELATYALSQELGMDHLPEATARRIDINGNKQLGLVVRDLVDQYAENGFDIQKYSQAPSQFKTYDRMAQYDKKMGDKLAFDILIGNTDRHHGNMMVKHNNKDKAEMLAFDQGLSFPDNNYKYVREDFSNQYELYFAANNIKMTAGFVKNFADFVTGDNFEPFVDYVKNNIGEDEADAFVDRVAFFADKIFNEKTKTVKSSSFFKHEWSK